MHPNSIRISQSLASEILPVAGFKEAPGLGIEGEVAGRKILLGSRAWLEKCRVTAHADARGNSGAATLVAIDGICRGAFLFENSLRPEVAQLIA
jgi:cation transport ATPase